MEDLGFRVLDQLCLFFFLLFVQSSNRQLWKARDWGPRTEPLSMPAEGLPAGQLERPIPCVPLVFPPGGGEPAL